MIANAAPAILIVEDERIVAKDLQRSLADMGYDAYAIADSSEEAISCASAKRPDVVLMDIRITGQEDGIRTAEALKQAFDVIVIYLTAHADEATIDRAKRTEPHGYLVKPVQDAELRSMIEIALYKRELERVRERLRVSERRLYTVTDNIPVAIGYFDREGRVQFANRVFREVVTYRDDALNVPARTFLGDSLHRESYPPRQRALAGEKVSFVAQVERNGIPRRHEVTYVPDRDPGGNVIGVYSLGYDVTEREQLGDELRQARVDLETILNNVPAGITSWRLDLTNRFANEAAEMQFGIPRGQAFGRHMQSVMGEDRFRKAQPFIEAAFAGQRSSHEQADREADDSLRYRQDHYIPAIEDGAVVGLYALSVDITELRKSHEQIRGLALRLDAVREEERRAVAVILHDGIAQDLFAMKLDLDHLEALAKRRASIKTVCKELTLAVTKCMEDTRQIANELRPSALAYSSLATVIGEHARRFAERSDLQISVTEATPVPALEGATQLLLFRAAQEALTNIARHARATAVQVTLKADSGRITMEITDDGIGITGAAMNKAHSLGLLGLRERFTALGGGLAVRRREPTGTTLTVYLPVDQEAHAV